MRESIRSAPYELYAMDQIIGLVYGGMRDKIVTLGAAAQAPIIIMPPSTAINWPVM